MIARDVNMPDRIRTKCHVAGISVWHDYSHTPAYRIVKISKGVVAELRTDTDLSANDWDAYIESILESWRATALKLGVL